jgi:hypothetical protein
MLKLLKDRLTKGKPKFMIDRERNGALLDRQRERDGTFVDRGRREFR